MKSMMKVASVVALALFALVGCKTGSASATSSAAASSAPASSAKTSSVAASSVDNSGLKVKLTIAGPATQADFIKGQVQSFLTDNGYTGVTFEMMNMGEDKADSQITDWTTGPDIYAYASDKTLNLLKQGALAKVPTAYATAYKTGMTAGAIEAGTINEKMVAYPYAGDNGYFLFYNKDIVSDEQAKTVEGIEAACAAAGVKFGYPLETAFYSGAAFMTYGSRYNVTINDEGTDISAITADFNTQKGYDAAKAVQTIVRNANVDPKTTKAPTKANGYGAIIDGSWNNTAHNTAVGADKLGVAVMPTITLTGHDATHMASFLGYKLYGVNPQVSSKDTARLALDHAIANYLVSAKTQEARFDTFSIAPTDKTVAALSKVTSNKFIKAISDQSAYAVAQTVVPGSVWNVPPTIIAKMEAAELTDAQIQTEMDAYNTSLQTLA
jgi:arabinogalactan oligomer / maltooligosaccharide transport system substrate-binding protein